MVVLDVLVIFGNDRCRVVAVAAQRVPRASVIGYSSMLVSALLFGPYFIWDGSPVTGARRKMGQST